MRFLGLNAKQATPIALPIDEDHRWTHLDPASALVEHKRVRWEPGLCSWAGRTHIMQFASKEQEQVDDMAVEPSDECPICLRMLFKPVTTACSHSFCSSCWDHLKQSVASRETACPMCRSSVTDVKRWFDLDELLEQRYPIEWRARAAADARGRLGTLFAAVPLWQENSPTAVLDRPPLVHLAFAALQGALQATDMQPVEVGYAASAGLHRIERIGGFTLENFVFGVRTVAGNPYYFRFNSAPVKLVARGTRSVVASLCVERSGSGEALTAYAADLRMTKEAAAHRDNLIGILDMHQNILVVRDADTPLGKAVLTWLLLRCVGLDATGIRHAGHLDM